MANRVMGILLEIRPEGDFLHSQDYLTDGLLDSTDIVALVAGLDEAFGISIDGTDIVPEHFQNAAAITRLLEKYGVGP